MKIFNCAARWGKLYQSVQITCTRHKPHQYFHPITSILSITYITICNWMLSELKDLLGCRLSCWEACMQWASAMDHCIASPQWDNAVTEEAPRLQSSYPCLHLALSLGSGFVAPKLGSEVSTLWLDYPQWHAFYLRFALLVAYTFIVLVVSWSVHQLQCISIAEVQSIVYECCTSSLRG